MLLSLLKILLFFAVVLLLALGAVYLSETGQMLRIEYGGTEFALTPVKALLALLPNFRSPSLSSAVRLSRCLSLLCGSLSFSGDG